jgi:hypothetical protein
MSGRMWTLDQTGASSVTGRTGRSAGFFRKWANLISLDAYQLLDLDGPHVF